LRAPQVTRSRLRRSGAHPRLLGGKRPRPRVPGAAEGPSEPERPPSSLHGVPTMSARSLSCRRIEADLVATATREAGPDAARRVDEHVRHCAPCRDELERYGALERAMGTLRETTPAPADDARAALVARLADLRSRLVAYGIFPSPLGRLL